MTVNAAEIQTRTSPFGYYATHAPCGAVLTVQYHPVDKDAYTEALFALSGHTCATPAPETLECGCVIRFDTDRESGTLAWFTPCSEDHRRIAQMSRKPGSMIVVGKVQS